MTILVEWSSSDMARLARAEARGEQDRIGSRCDSSCTLFLAARRSCVSPEAVFGFHAPWAGAAIGGIVLTRRWWPCSPVLTNLRCAGYFSPISGMQRRCPRTAAETHWPAARESQAIACAVR